MLSNGRRVSSLLALSSSLHIDLFFSSSVGRLRDLRAPHQWQHPRSLSFLVPYSSGISHGTLVSILHQKNQHSCSMVSRAYLTSEASKRIEGPRDIVMELYLKMFKSVEAETMPPNAWLWSLISNCTNQEDIKLLFQILQQLRRFRLSNLRINANFNCHLCLRVAETCARAGALDFGKKTLWKHNVYGLSPSIGSAHYLLLYAKEHNDTKHMVEVMKLLKRNSLPLQPGTADIVFSICYNTGDWNLISKYSKRFLEAGVKLHRTAFDIWMEFAAKIGDSRSIWKIEKLRSKSVKQLTVVSGISCAKGHLLERKPENAAAIIHVLNQSLPDQKKPHLAVELQKMVNEWPSEVLKHKKEEDRKELAASLRSNIPVMVESLLNMGLDVVVNLENLIQE